MNILFIYKNSIILSLFEIDTLNFTMYLFFNDFDMPFKKCVIGLHNLVSMNTFFTIND